MSISSGAVAFPPVALTNRAALAFLYEHPQWFAQLFAELERRKVPFDKIFIPDHFYEVGPPQTFKVLFNRMSPSANSRQHGSGIFHTLAYLEHLQLQGVRVINGAKAFRYEVSKAGQASLLKSLGLRYLPSRVIHAAHQAVAAAEGLRYPIIVKANTGGSGKGIASFNSKAELAAAATGGLLDLGYDSVALVQEFVPARRRFHHTGGNAGRQVSVCHQGASQRRDLRSMPGRHLPDRGGTGLGKCLRCRGRKGRPQGRRIRGAHEGDPRHRKHRSRCRH